MMHLIQRRGIHASTSLQKWEMKNRRVFPPQKRDEPRRPAVEYRYQEHGEREFPIHNHIPEMFYSRKNIKHSKRKMWYAANFVKGMMIEDAITQLTYVNKKAADIAREVLLEAQEEAVAKHNFEYKSNMHIAAAIATRAKSEHAMRYHAKGRSSILDLVYCHFFVCLREGPPPEEKVLTGYDQAEDYMRLLRKRNIPSTL